MVEQLFLAVPWGCLRFVIVVFPDHTHLLFLVSNMQKNKILKNIKVLSAVFLHIEVQVISNLFLKGYSLEAKTAPKN